MPKLNIEIKGIDKTIKKLSKLGDKAIRDVDDVTLATALDIVKDAKILAPKDMGKLSQSIAQEKIAPMNYRIFTNPQLAPYAPYIEFGTGSKVSVPSELQGLASKFKGGRGGSFEDGLDAIKEWCKRKGIEESAAYPIFISILKKGIEPQPFLYPSFVVNRQYYIEDLKKLLKDYGKNFS